MASTTLSLSATKTGGRSAGVAPAIPCVVVWQCIETPAGAWPAALLCISCTHGSALQITQCWWLCAAMWTCKICGARCLHTCGSHARNWNQRRPKKAVTHTGTALGSQPTWGWLQHLHCTDMRSTPPPENIDWASLLACLASSPVGRPPDSADSHVGCRMILILVHSSSLPTYPPCQSRSGRQRHEVFTSST